MKNKKIKLVYNKADHSLEKLEKGLEDLLHLIENKIDLKGSVKTSSQNDCSKEIRK